MCVPFTPLQVYNTDHLSGMDLVTAWPPGKHEKAKAFKQSSNSGYDDLDFVSPTSAGSVQSLHHRGNPNARPPPTSILGSNTAQDPTIRGVQFDMHLSNEAAKTKTHIYTSIQSEIGSAARTLEQVPHWQAMFPQLATRYNEGRIDCPLFLFESRLRLIDDIRLGLSLGIEFAIDFAEGAHFHEWRSLTRVHKQDITPQYFDDSEFEQTWDRLECLESGTGQSDIQLTVPFKSKWWVKLFSSIISKRDGARNAKDREAIKLADEYPTAYLRELSITQELWATPRGGSSQHPQRMAILLWTFNQIRNGEAATTTWRPLTLSTSASPYQVQEPILRGMQPSMNLDSALQESMVAQPQQAVDYYGHQQPQGLFAENSEQLLTSQISECNTESTTPILDYRSFPSSTSTSFPSSISNASGFPGHHGNSFDSGDGRSYSQSLESSFHSQHDHTTVYGMPDPNNSNGPPSLKPQESYDSQDLLYQSQPGSVYGPIGDFQSYDHSQNADDTIIVNPQSQSDFTQGGIRLAYATGGQPQLPQSQDGVYEAPLIAPRANMLPQGQLEQSLQSFEQWVPPPPPSAGRGLLTQQRQQQRRGQSQQENDDDEDDDEDDGDEGEVEEEVCDNSQLSAQHHPSNGVSPHGQGHETEEDGEDEERQRQQQLQYLNDAQDHWQQSFHPALWAQGLQIPAISGGDGIMDMNSPPPTHGPPTHPQQPSDMGQVQVMGEIRERIEGMQGGRGWEVR